MLTNKQKIIGNIDLVKQLNSAAVYFLIDQQGPISRTQITEVSQLAPASVTKITRQLLDRGLIKEVEQQASTGGRRAISIVSEHKAFHSVAIRLGRNKATIALYDLGGKLLAETIHDLFQHSQQELEAELMVIIANFISTNKYKIKELIAISIVLPGLVDPIDGIVKYMPHIDVNNWALRKNIQEQFHVSCFIGHDNRSLALAEHYFGATRDCQDSLLIRIDRGIGAGIILNDKVFMGKRGNVGEIGHIQVDPLGERCYCGNFGCLETILSNTAIEKRCKLLLTQGYSSQINPNLCTIEHICLAANNADQLAIELIKHAGRYLGKAVAIAINLFNPEKIVIAGEIMLAKHILLPVVKACVEQQALKNFSDNIPIESSALDHYSAIGAFSLVKRSMLDGILLLRLLDENINE